jgi:nucleoside-diphosphate-sugar epimerase
VSLAAGMRLVIGSSSIPFSVTYADNLADFIVHRVKERSVGTWNLVDEETLTQGRWFRCWRQHLPDGPRPVYLPLALALGAARLLAASGRGRDLPYRLHRTCGPFRLSAAKARDELGWRPPVDLETSFRELTGGE